MLATIDLKIIKGAKFQMTMDKLSDKLILKIINYLSSLKDVLRCKQIDRRFHSIISNYHLDSLIISHLKLPLNKRWFYSFQLIDCFKLTTKDYSALQLDCNSILNNLKQLLIISTDWSNFGKYNLTKLFEQINAIKSLEHLELVGLKMKRTNFVNLNLVNLKVLNLERIEVGLGITLRTPSLISLKIDLFDSIDKKIKFTNPESIQLLIINYFETFITTFINLEYLYIKQILKLVDIKEGETNNDLFFNKLPNLKEIQFYEEKRTYHYLVSQKNLLKRENLGIYYCGIDFLDNNLDNLPNSNLSPYTNLDHNIIEFYAAFYSQTATLLPFVKRLVYDDLDHCLDKIPELLINKFVNLNAIEIRNRVKNPIVFIEFLRCFKNLKSLSFKRSELNQNFFNLLSQLQPILDALEIHSDDDLDFDFILKFSNLNHIYIGKNLELEFVYQVFERFGDLKFFFYYQDTELSLNVEGDKFEFCVKQEIVKLRSLSELFEHFQEVNFEELNDLLSDIEDYEFDENEDEDSDAF